jgi:hypothetical protein
MDTSAAFVVADPTEKNFSGLGPGRRLTGRMRLFAALAIACVTRTAAAERAIEVDVTGAPFAAHDLVDALRVRVASQGAPIHVRVTAASAGVHVEARGAARDVQLQGLSGAAAARLVALATDDLLLDDLATTPPPPASSGATLALLGTVASWDNTLTAGSLELAIPVGSAIVAIAAGGGELVTGKLSLYTAALRIDGGVRYGWVEARAGAVVVPVFVTSGKGDTTLVAGVGASVRARVPVASGVRAVLAAGVDAFADRTQYKVAGMTDVATPWWAIWAGLGVEVAL